MCDPVTAVIIGAQVVGGVMQAKAQNDAGKYNERLAKYNAQIQENAAKDAVRRGQKEADRERIRNQYLISSQRASFAANGIDLDSESPLALMEGTAALGEEDAMTIESNAAREAYGMKVQGFNYRAEGKLARKQGRSQAIGTLLSTGAKAGGSMQTYNANKVG